MSTLDIIAQTNRWRTRSLTEKMFLALGMLCLDMILPPLPCAVLIGIVMVGATLVGARVPLKSWVAGMAAPLGFLLTGLLPIAFNDPALATGLAVRSVAAVCCLLFLSMTTPATDIIRGLRRCGTPAEVADVALLIYRLLFLFADTAQTMNAAQAARLGTVGARRRLRSLGLLLANLLPRAFARAHRMETGLLARGWHGEMQVLSVAHPISPLGLTGVVLVQVSIACAGMLVS